KTGRNVPEPVQTQLIDSTHQDVNELLPFLQERAAQLQEVARKQLAERATKESAEMLRILEDQQKRILATAKRFDENKQLRFDFSDGEQRQAQLDREAWDKRLLALQKEMTTEPARVRDVYEVRAHRLEPVGLVYLWPVTG
ncbi:MAG: helicase, partial [Bdellovibrionales bacterium]|nr:helicase [Bdellovibrionales bacterium]